MQDILYCVIVFVLMVVFVALSITIAVAAIQTLMWIFS